MAKNHIEGKVLGRFIVAGIGSLSLFWGLNACFGGERQEKGFGNTAGVQQSQTGAIPVVRTVGMNIHYQIERVSGVDLVRVELWYGRGMSGEWQLYDFDHDMVSPVKFVAPGEGIFRFLVVATDRWGRRSYESSGADRSLGQGVSEGALAQMMVFVDYTAPRLYLYSPRGDIQEGNGDQLEFRWAGFDSNLASRPVGIYYQEPANPGWRAIEGSLMASGEFTWRIPAAIKGPMEIKAILTDRAGNVDVQFSGIIHFQRSKPATWEPEKGVYSEESSLGEGGRGNEKVMGAEALRGGDTRTGAETGGGVGAKGEKPVVVVKPLVEAGKGSERAVQSILRGNLYIQRREWPEASRAFEEALEIEPSNIEARINLAESLVQLGQVEQAQKHYKICLEQDPGYERAMFRLGQTQMALEQYAEAQETYTRLLAEDKRDFQVWLLLGNVSEELGQLDVARSSWQMAAVDSSPVKELAREALERTKR
jgi:tetratricopeptide (TPR) repeat protein